jgi:hypothetical protein
VGGLRFHGLVRAGSGRVAAALLIVLLAGAERAPGSLSVASEEAAPSPQDDGMAATPAHPASAVPAIAPAGMAAPPASATLRVLVTFPPLLGRIVTGSTSRLPVAVRPAPTVLRV